MSDYTPKTCSKCGEQFPATAEYFGKDKSTPDGLTYACRECRRNTARKNYHVKRDEYLRLNYDPDFKNCTQCKQKFPRTSEFFCTDHRAKDGLSSNCRKCQMIATDKWRKNNPEKSRAITKRHRDKYPEKTRAASKVWREKNRQKANDASRDWQRRNLEYYRQHSRRRAAQKRDLAATFTKDDWQHALEHFHGCCAYCGNPPSLFDNHRILQQDHFIPLTQNGTYTPDNIVPACQSCNIGKKNLDPHEWLIKRFGRRKAKVILECILNYFSQFH